VRAIGREDVVVRMLNHILLMGLTVPVVTPFTESKLNQFSQLNQTELLLVPLCSVQSKKGKTSNIIGICTFVH
jgi:hypothetical protein